MGGNVSLNLLNSVGTIEGEVGAVLAVTDTTGATSAITTPNDRRGIVDIVADAACFIRIGTAPTATTTTSYYLPANTIVRMSIKSGNKIAAITSSGTANLYYHVVAQLPY